MNVPGDGSCLVYATLLSMWCQLGMAIFFGSALYLRVAAINLMKTNPAQFEPHYNSNAAQYQTQGSPFYRKNFLEYCDILMISPFIFADEIFLLAIATLLNARFRVEVILFDQYGEPYLVEEPNIYEPLFRAQGMNAHNIYSVVIVNVNNAHYWAINLDTRVRKADLIMLEPDVSLMKLLSSTILNSHAMKLIRRKNCFGDRSSLWPLDMFQTPQSLARPAPRFVITDQAHIGHVMAEIRRLNGNAELNSLVDAMLEDGYSGNYPLLRDFNNAERMEKVDFLRCRPDPGLYERRGGVTLFQVNDIIMNEFSVLLNEWDHGRYIQDHARLRSYCIRSQFATRLLEDLLDTSKFHDEIYNFADICRWTKNMNIFSLDILCIPIHRPGHWIVIVVFMQQKEIHCYDHSGAFDGEDLMLGILHWMSDLANISRTRPTAKNPTVPEIVPGEWLLINKRLSIPFNARQSDNASCGYFVMILMQYLFNNIRIEDVDYTQDDMKTLFRRRVACDLARASL